MATTTLSRKLEKQLIALGDKANAEKSKRFFKTGQGQYSVGDKFLGIRTPILRQTAKDHHDELTLEDLVAFLQSDWHEIRLFALFGMVNFFKRAGFEDQQRTVAAYFKNIKHINNWDLVDSAAYQIVGAWHHDKDRSPVDKLIPKKHLWSRRIAMMSTFYHIRQNDLDDTYRYAEFLLSDKEDLIHKVSGWMLREAGKRDTDRLEKFLDIHIDKLPRTMLRYAIKKLPAERRKYFLTL